MVVRPGATPEHGQGHHIGRLGPGGDKRRLGGQGDFGYRPNQPGSYPIVPATYEIVCSKYPDSQVGTAVKAFPQSTIGAGQNGLADNGYIPIPDQFESRSSIAVNAIF